MRKITSESLARAYGVPVPDELVPLLRFALEAEDGDPDIASCALRPGLGFDVIGPAARAMGVRGERWRPPSMPPEFLPLGALGADGVMYGFLVHAPELARSDWPLVEFQPMVPPISGIAEGFCASLERLASRMISYEATHGLASREEDPRIGRIAALIGIAPSGDKACWDEHMARPIVPEAPAGWRYEPAPDGVGVLAPAEAFRPGAAPWSKDEPLDDTIAIATKELRDGFAASALLRSNTAFAAHWTGFMYPDAFARLVPLRGRAYRALGRPLHAKNLRENASP